MTFSLRRKKKSKNNWKEILRALKSWSGLSTYKRKRKRMELRQRISNRKLRISKRNKIIPKTSAP